MKTCMTGDHWLSVFWSLEWILWVLSRIFSLTFTSWLAVSPNFTSTGWKSWEVTFGARKEREKLSSLILEFWNYSSILFDNWFSLKWSILSRFGFNKWLTSESGSPGQLSHLPLIEIKGIGRGDTMQKWHIFIKNEKFSKRSDGFFFVLFYLKLLIRATNKGGPKKHTTIPFGILGPSKFTESV